MNFKAIFTKIKQYWYLIPLLGLTLTLMHTREDLSKTKATLTTERAAWDKASKLAKEQKKLDEQHFSDIKATALKAFDIRKELMEPVILRSTNTVREYAQTPESHVVCTGPDWVRKLTAHRDTLVTQDPGTP
jgi:hypothetical protein